MLDAATTTYDRPSETATNLVDMRKDNIDARPKPNADGAQKTVEKLIDGNQPFTLIDAETNNGKTDDRAKERDWTLAVNLTTDLGKTVCTVDSQTKQLRDMAEKTRDNPGLRIIVQGAFLKDDNGIARNTNQFDFSKGKPSDNFQLKRFEIADGKITELPTTQSHGLAKDSEDLVALAVQYSAKHIALLQQAHGLGNAGEQGATGGATMQDITDAISKGLNSPGSKFQKLDVLDFDNCLMAEKGVGAMTQKVAKYMVASEETEGNFDDTANGQNRERLIDDLLKNPKMDGRELGNALVQAAKDGADIYQTPRGPESGVQTLTNFDLSRADEYNQSLDKIADDLSARLTDPAQRQKVEQALQGSLRLGATVDQQETEEEQRRDVSNFVNNIQKQIDAGTIPDRDGTLKKDIEDYRAAERNFVVTNYGEKNGYESTGGVTAYLPSDKNLDLQKRANDVNPLQRVNDFVSPHGESAAQMLGQDQQIAAESAQSFTGLLKNVLANTPSAAAGLTQLKQAVQKFGASTNEQELTASMAEVKVATAALEADPATERQLREFASRQVHSKHDGLQQLELVNETKSWQDFIQQLIRTSSAEAPAS